MANVQEVFNRIQEVKQKQKEIKSILRDAFATSAEYQKILEQLKTLKVKKMQVESAIRSGFSRELEKLEEYALDLKSDNMLLSDASLTKIMKGESLEITDQYENKYEPIFSVRFKKMG